MYRTLLMKDTKIRIPEKMYRKVRTFWGTCSASYFHIKDSIKHLLAD